jgi:hypothetical protein
MDHPLSTGSVRLKGHPSGRLDVNGMKRVPAMLNVETDCVHRGISTGKCISDGPLIMDVGLERS